MSALGAITAIAGNAGRRALRSPLFLAMTTALGALLYSFPPVDPADPTGAVRLGAATVVATLTAVLGAAALVSTVARPGAWRDVAALRLRGPRAAAAGEALGLALVLFAAAGGGATAGIVRLVAGGADPGVLREEPYFRRVLWTNERAVALAPGETLSFVVTPDAAALGGVVLDLGGRLVRPAGAAATRPVGAAGEADDEAIRIRWRRPGRPWREDFLRPVRGRIARVRLPSGDGVSVAESLEIRVSAPSGKALRLGRGDAAVLGGRRPAASAMLRAAFVAACGAWAAASLLRAFSARLSPSLALPATLTALLFAAAASDVYGAESAAARLAEYLPGGDPYDPGDALRLGRSVEWSDVGRAGLRAAVVFLVASVAARRPEAERA